ncbi:MAG: hybrid sensor histidine kinase/response regulator [Burkholderiales bacterium]|nr:hybrid sensor histidine kinase/response regulator [Burkholderiales bacterium]
MTSQAAAAPRAALILAEQANSIQGNIFLLIVGNAITAVVAAWIMVDPAPLGPVLAWLAVQLGLAALSLAQALRIRHRPATPRNAARRLRGNTIGIAISGAVWAFGVLVFWPSGRLDMQLLLSIVIMGSLTAVLHSVSGWLPAFYAFFFPCTASVVLASLWEGSAANIAFAITTTIYGVTCTRFAARLNGTLLESLRARHEIAELAADLRVQKERAEEASQAKSRFLAAASHDLRQPVHALALFVGALRQEPPGPQAQRLLDRVESTVGTMGTMFNALLDISKLDAGMVGAERRPCNLRPLLERVCAEEGAVAAQKGLALRANLRDAWVATDPVLFERIVRNLVVNAVRYTDRGGVLVALCRRGAEVVLRVVDTGIGIASARQEEVFHEFVQLHNPERDRHQGLGLGLAIVRRLADLLGIRLCLRSHPGRGSSFTLRLGAMDAVDTAAARDPAAALAPVAAARATPADAGLVLVIDDDADIRTGMRALLCGWGHAVVDAGGLVDLLPQLHGLKVAPQLIISDYRLRGEETGHRVVERLRHEYNDDTPAIIITGDTAPERLREAAAGGHVLLHKPVGPEQLREGMARALAARAAQAAA